MRGLVVSPLVRFQAIRRLKAQQRLESCSQFRRKTTLACFKEETRSPNGDFKEA